MSAKNIYLCFCLEMSVSKNTISYVEPFILLLCVFSAKSRQKLHFWRHFLAFLDFYFSKMPSPSLNIHGRVFFPSDHRYTLCRKWNNDISNTQEGEMRTKKSQLFYAAISQKIEVAQKIPSFLFSSFVTIKLRLAR